MRLGCRGARFGAAASAWVILALLAAWCSSASGQWPTNRGNVQRTGNIDGQPGPMKPNVRWAYKAQEHFIASPVPAGKALYVSGLGAFNTGVFHCLAMQPDAPERVLWSKAAPYLKRPMVCAPGVVEGLLVFGDGMHQTDGAMLYCLRADSGRPLWQLPLPGRLVHLEGSPTIANGRVYIGGGEAGILCVDLRRVTLDGKEQDLAAVQAAIERRWTELVAKYEQDRKNDPDFALPPSEEALPKPAPKLLWQRGQGKWHVDAPVAVVGNRVLAASAYIDEDKVGRRALVCLNAGDGSVAWETPLKINPWAGPTIAGNLVLVGCSSIRFDTKRVKQARGEVIAFDLASGRVKWRKAVPGGILSPIAAKGDLAVFTATDGKVRAWIAATGQQKWIYDAANPFFAGPAVAGDLVYVADLRGVVHAVGLVDGRPKWVLDVAADPAIQLPGMVFGSPVVHQRRLYLATCNLEGQAVDQPCAVVCLSDEAAGAAVVSARAIAVDKQRRTVAIPCRIAPRRLPTLKDIYPLEVVATYPSPRGQKAHETVVTFEARPSDVHKAMEGFGLKAGRPARGAEGTAEGPEVKIFLELAGLNGRPRFVPIEKTMVDRRTGKPLPSLRWYFTGSAFRQPDPNKDYKVYGADLAGTLIAIFPVTDETVFQTNLTMKESTLLRLETNRNVLPDEGTAVRLIIQVSPPPQSFDTAASQAFAPVPLPLFVTAPQPSPSSALVPAPRGTWRPPLADVLRLPRLLPSEHDRPVRPRPVADLPLLGRGSPSLPPPRLPPATPQARAASPDPNRLPLLPAGSRPNPNHADATSDPTLGQARQALLWTIGGLRRSPAPFLRLTIPDPFEAVTAVQFRHCPADDDTPAVLPDLPGRPTLTVKP